MATARDVLAALRSTPMMAVIVGEDGTVAEMVPFIHPPTAEDAWRLNERPGIGFFFVKSSIPYSEAEVDKRIENTFKAYLAMKATRDRQRAVNASAPRATYERDGGSLGPSRESSAGASDALRPIQSSVVSCLVTLEIGGKQRLVVLLSADGTINRLDDGTPKADGALHIGVTSPELFQSLMKKFDPTWLKYFGQRFSIERTAGEPCLLRIAVETEEGTKVFECEYGSESQGLPQEIAQFVNAAVEITDPWFEARRVEEHSTQKKQWWKLW